MNTRNRSILALLLTTGVIALALPKARAQQPVAANYSAVITSVDDRLNVFNGLLTPGKTVGGHYDYDPAQLDTVAIDAFTALHVSNKRDAAHFSFAAGPLALGANYLILTTVNDRPGTGDNYGISYNTNYPALFTQFDSDLYDVTYPVLSLSLNDPYGQALSSLDTPLTIPSLSQFTQAEGSLRVIVTDLNTFDEFTATAKFRITRLDAVVPEPGSLALLLVVGVSGGMLALRRRAK